MTKQELEQRNKRCVEEGLDFISLKPFPKDVTVGTIYHAELEQSVQTLYVPNVKK